MGNLVDVFSHRMPMGIAIFDNQLVLQRFNPTWADYIEALTPSLEEITPGLSLTDLLPDAVDLIIPYTQQALAGKTMAQDALRLVSQDTIYYWNTMFTPVITEVGIIGFSLIATDVTDRVLTQQLLERHVADRTRKLSALYDVMTLAAEPAELREILDKSLARVLTAVQSQAGMIQLLDSSSEFLHLAVHQNLPVAVARALQITAAQSYLSGKLVRDWTPLVLKDVANNPEAHPVMAQSGLHAYAGLQMNAKGRVVGVLSVFRTRKRPFVHEDIALLDSVADQIGTAIENARLRKENEQLLVLEERNRLARELHDAVTQSLYSITLFAEANRRFAADENFAMCAEYATRLGDTAQQALREMRLLVHNLRPSILEQAGLIRAIQQRLDGVERRTGIQASLQAHDHLNIPAHVEEALYHITQEALNNALKHAVAGEVTVSIAQNENWVQLCIADNGRGFDIVHSDDSGGLGLISMRERVELLGGSLKIKTAVTQGTVITVNLNLKKVGEPAHNFNTFDLV